ncbi:MAG: FAD-binding oxidoreductase [Acidimicrobiaceae bacterium]|nr:FAD-binding oxidoreductase [Acidimicrobiaceae bacterium]
MATGASKPLRNSYDVVIVGGAMIGSSIAWFLSDLKSSKGDFDGSVLVVERDPSYENSSTGRTNSCMRQQFSNGLNIKISQFGAEYVRNFARCMGSDSGAPELAVNHFGYMYLASDQEFADVLRHNQQIQRSLGAGTRMMDPDEIASEYPFYNVEDIICGSHNLVDEGYFDGGTMFDWWRRKASHNGVEYLANEVVGVDRRADAVRSVRLATGEDLSVGNVVNASGPRAALTARMAGLELPVEPRRRYTFMFDAARRLKRDLPLTIDPTGVHVRSDGDVYMAGCAPDDDRAVDYDDLRMDRDIWEDKVWPALAHRIPAFERIKVTHQWAGHYAYNTLDHNVIVGRHTEVSNFIFANGFSGHGLQQSPAIGRGVAELIAYDEYRSLDLSPLGYDRIARQDPFIETAII